MTCRGRFGPAIAMLAALLLAAGGARAQNGTALDFDGVDDRVDVDDPINLAGPLTIETDLGPHFGDWAHVAVTWAGSAEGTLRMYIKSIEVASDVWLGSIADAPGPFRLGATPDDVSFYDGSVDEVRIFETVVPDATLQTWMHRRMAADHPQFASLAAAWSLEEGAGQHAASIVMSPQRDGRLGTSPGPDEADPVWLESGQVATRPVSLSDVKARFDR